MQKRVTLSQIARRTKVSVMTVSRALRNDPRVKPETAVLIRTVAEELGYAPDPVLASLIAYRRAGRPAQYHGTIAWVTNWATPNGWAFECFQLYRDGANERLARHGYRLEDFWLREEGLTAKRASQILINRGIRGLLICPLQGRRGHLSLDWPKFCAVSLGYTLSRPKLHLFTAAHYRALITCMRKLRALGYRKIGLVASNEMVERMEGIWTAGYISQLALMPESQLVPIFHYESDTSNIQPAIGNKSRKEFDAWYWLHRPEAIVSVTLSASVWALECKLPEECRVVTATLQESEKNLWGVVEANREIGGAAADFLVSMIQRGEYGVPKFPQRVMLEGQWFGGTTAPQRTSPRTLGAVQK